MDVDGSKANSLVSAPRKKETRVRSSSMTFVHVLYQAEAPWEFQISWNSLRRVIERWDRAPSEQEFR